MQRSGSETLFKTDLEQAKKAIKIKIRKHLKLKEGTENLKKVTTDKKTKAKCNAIIKEDNAKLQDLHDELQDLNARVSEGVSCVNDDALSPDKTDGVSNGSGGSRIEYLKKQIDVEMKIKQGAENMLAIHSASGSKKKDIKLTAAVKQRLEDSRRKIDILRDALLREQQQGIPVGKEDGVLMGDSSGKENDAHELGLSPLELTVEDVRHQIEIESKIMKGAKNIIEALYKSGQHDGLKKAERRFHESRQKLNLLYCSHSRHIGELNPEQAALGIYKEDNTLPSYRKSVALTGELDVCITGADRLLVVVPNRDPRKLSLAMVSPDGKTGECAGFNKKCSLSVEVCVVLKLDNNVAGKTSWKTPGTECWKEQFRIKLDKSRELEVEVYWRDHRSLCGVAFLRLEELLDNQRRQIQVPLEPQGCLFAEVTFLNPTVTKKRRPQRQKRAFHFHKDAEKNFPRAGQKNTTFNVATRDRLQKTTALPDCTTNNSTLSPHSTSSPFPRDRAKIFVQQAPLVEVIEDLESSHTDNLTRGQQELRYTSVTKEKPIQNCEKKNTPPNNRKTKNQMIQENWNKDDCCTAASRSSFSDSYNHSSIDQPRAAYMRRNSKRKKSPCGPIDSLSEIEIPQINGKRYTQGPHGEVEDKVNQEEPIIVNSPYSCIGSHQTMPTVERPGVPVDMPADHSNASDSYLHSFAGSEKYMPEAGKRIEFAQENHVCASDGLNHFTEEDEANRSNRDETLEAKFVEELCAARDSVTDEWSKNYDVLCDGLNDATDSDHSDPVRHTTPSDCDSTDNLDDINESEDLRGKSHFVRIHERSNTIPSTSSENVCSKCEHLQENGNSPPTPTETRIHLMKDAEKNFLRAGQKNTTFNVATRDRLQKTTALPDCTTNNSTLSPHSTSSPFPRDRAENFVEQAPLLDYGKVTEELGSSHTDNLTRGQQELRYTSVTKENPIQNCEKKNTPPNNRKTKNQMIQENWNKDDCCTAASRSSFSDSYNHSSIDQPRAAYMRRNSKRKKSPCGPIDSLSEIEIPQINGKRYTQGPHGEVEDKVNQEEPIIVNSPYSCIGSHQTMPTVERPGVPVDMPADHSNASDSYLHSFAGSEKYMPEAGKRIEFAQENHVCASGGLNHFTEEDEANRSNRDETLEAKFVEELCAARDSVTDEWSKNYDVLCDGLNDATDSDHSDPVRHTTPSDCDSTDNLDDINESEDLRGKSHFVIIRIHERSNTIPSTSSENVCSKCEHLQENGNSPPTPTETRIHLMKGVTVLSKCWDIRYLILHCIFLCLVLILGFLLYRIWCASCRSVRNVVHYAALDRPFLTLFEWIKSLRSDGIEDGNLAQLPSDVVKSLMSDSCSPEEIVVQLKESLHLVEKCLEQPNPETKRMIRSLAKRANDLNRIDVVKHLREITPGTTGGEEWKNVAEKLGVSPTEIRFLDERKDNPCEAALASISQRRHITVDDLYDVLTECGYPVLADTL